MCKESQAKPHAKLSLLNWAPEESQTGAGYAEEVRVHVRHVLVGSLGGGVEREWVVRAAVGHGERQLLVPAVHARARGIDQVLDRMVAATFG